MGGRSPAEPALERRGFDDTEAETDRFHVNILDIPCRFGAIRTNVTSFLAFINLGMLNSNRAAVLTGYGTPADNHTRRTMDVWTVRFVYQMRCLDFVQVTAVRPTTTRARADGASTRFMPGRRDIVRLAARLPRQPG